MNREADKFWARFVKDLNPLATAGQRIRFYSFIFVLLVGALVILGRSYSYNSPDPSWKQYVEETRMAERSEEEKARHVLFYVTRYKKDAQDMTPEHINHILNNSEMGSIDLQSIKKYFGSHPGQFERSSRNGAYTVTDSEAAHMRREYRGCVIELPATILWGILAMFFLEIVRVVYRVGQMLTDAKKV